MTFLLLVATVLLYVNLISLTFPEVSDIYGLPMLVYCPIASLNVQTAFTFPPNSFAVFLPLYSKIF